MYISVYQFRKSDVNGSLHHLKNTIPSFNCEGVLPIMLKRGIFFRFMVYIV